MVGVEWLVVTALLALAAGWGLSRLGATRPGTRQARILELENQLEAARQELEDYREEVIAQFSETARRFKTLDDSYGALHRQLAESSSLLCGAAPGPLLEAPAPRTEPELAAADGTPDRQTAQPDSGAAGEAAAAGAPAADATPTAASGSPATDTPDDIVVAEPESETAAPPKSAAAS